MRAPWLAVQINGGIHFDQSITDWVFPGAIHRVRCGSTQFRPRGRLAIRRTDREQTAVQALIDLLSRQTAETFAFDHHPDEAPVNGQRPKAPDYLFHGRMGELMLEHTALARDIPSQQRRARVSRMYAAIGTTSWPRGSYRVDIFTDDARRVEQLVRSGGFATLVHAASELMSLEGLDFDVRLFAFHSRNQRFYVGDSDGVLLLSKETETGSGYAIIGPHDTAPPDGEMCVPNHERAAVRVPTTSRTLLDVEDMRQGLERLFEEAEGKFGSRDACRGVVLIDVAHYPAGPILIAEAIHALPLSRWPRVTWAAFYVDEPYSEPPPPSGEVCGTYRMWLVAS